MSTAAAVAQAALPPVGRAVLGRRPPPKQRAPREGAWRGPSARARLPPSERERPNFASVHSTVATSRDTFAVACRATPERGGPGEDIGLGPLAGVYDAVGEWLVRHPAPLWLVNSPLKTRVTEILAGASYDPEASVAAVKVLIASDDVVVFSATYCPFSAAAKAALRAEGVPFTAVEWNTTPGGGGFAPALATLTGRSSIPHVFIGGESVGGCNDGTPGIRPLIASGHLDEVLEICSETTRSARAAHAASMTRR
uniref:Glutaredoxin domain-containing protein n=1 Tax=Mantoniella antarctica TaxID=81844 RepID=A0A7S0SZ88_9CHLO|mmetsp:Transcript_5292/g.13312  ORF Transcript_5292/g.13312 Transcript_5292/m.13312 type:complete len:254 (+) Transcript_5292:93-854(+)